MNLKNLVIRGGSRMLLSASIVSVMFASSCQKDAATNPDTIPASTLSATNLSPLAATAVKYTVSAPINLSNKSNQTISGISINGATGNAIHLSGCSNITITNVKITNTKLFAILLDNCTNITIQSDSIMTAGAGVMANTSSGIKVTNNYMSNMTRIGGASASGNADFVQFNAVSGKGNRVSNNKFVNEAGKNSCEDAVNMYRSNGDPSDPILIWANTVTGSGLSSTGGGIMLGDNGGSYQDARYNTLINPGNYGMAVSGGTAMTIAGNIIFSKQTANSNCGLYVWNQQGTLSKMPPCSIITVSDNRVNWTMKNGQINNTWNGANCGTITGWSSNKYDATLKF